MQENHSDNIGNKKSFLEKFNSSGIFKNPALLIKKVQIINSIKDPLKKFL